LRDYLFAVRCLQFAVRCLRVVLFVLVVGEAAGWDERRKRKGDEMEEREELEKEEKKIGRFVGLEVVGLYGFE